MLGFHYILNTLNSIPSSSWNIIINVIIGAIPASFAAWVVKKIRSIDNDLKMVGIVITTSMLASGAAYLMRVPQFKPGFVIVQGWLIFATTQPVYYIFVKRLGVRLEAWFVAQIAKVATVNEAKVATVPPQGLPITATPATVEDFSH